MRFDSMMQRIVLSVGRIGEEMMYYICDER